MEIGNCELADASATIISPRSVTYLEEIHHAERVRKSTGAGFMGETRRGRAGWQKRWEVKTRPLPHLRTTQAVLARRKAGAGNRA